MPLSFCKILKTKKKLANERREVRGQDRECR
uniref:Uncharacterized protein n=1 Tax=Siphoviridae sp. ctAjZ17 TaxID=2827797 RepID=A0A8S5SP35_9CAUD|nr:MAG TPA: hypothetical protein [Siphoviridae sp. ctAjZ17]